MRLGQTSIVYLISKFGSAVVVFLATIYFTRLLGEEIYGYYAITLALVSWLALVKNVGFSRAMIKRMSEDETEADAYLIAGMTIKTLLMLVVIIGVIVFHQEINSYVGQPVAEFVILILVISVISVLVNTGLQGKHKVHIFAPLGTIMRITRNILVASQSGLEFASGALN